MTVRSSRHHNVSQQNGTGMRAQQDLGSKCHRRCGSMRESITSPHIRHRHPYAGFPLTASLILITAIVPMQNGQFIIRLRVTGCTPPTHLLLFLTHFGCRFDPAILRTDQEHHPFVGRVSLKEDGKILIVSPLCNLRVAAQTVIQRFIDECRYGLRSIWSRRARHFPEDTTRIERAFCLIHDEVRTQMRSLRDLNVVAPINKLRKGRQGESEYQCKARHKPCHDDLLSNIIGRCWAMDDAYDLIDIRQS